MNWHRSQRLFSINSSLFPDIFFHLSCRLQPKLPQRLQLHLPPTATGQLAVHPRWYEMVYIIFIISLNLEVIGTQTPEESMYTEPALSVRAAIQHCSVPQDFGPLGWWVAYEQYNDERRIKKLKCVGVDWMCDNWYIRYVWWGLRNFIMTSLILSLRRNSGNSKMV